MSNTPPPYEDPSSSSQHSPTDSKKQLRQNEDAPVGPLPQPQPPSSNGAPPPYDTLSIQQPEFLLDPPIKEAERHERAIAAYKVKREEEEKKNEGGKETLGWAGMFFVAVLGLFGA